MRIMLVFFINDKHTLANLARYSFIPYERAENFGMFISGATKLYVPLFYKIIAGRCFDHSIQVIFGTFSKYQFTITSVAKYSHNTKRKQLDYLDNNKLQLICLKNA